MPLARVDGGKVVTVKPAPPPPAPKPAPPPPKPPPAPKPPPVPPPAPKPAPAPVAQAVHPGAQVEIPGTAPYVPPPGPHEGGPPAPTATTTTTTGGGGGGGAGGGDRELESATVEQAPPGVGQMFKELQVEWFTGPPATHTALQGVNDGVVDILRTTPTIRVQLPPNPAHL